MKIHLGLTLLLLATCLCLPPVIISEDEISWSALPAAREELHIPDILGFQTLKCDFHMHTVFSDGLVWPTVRIDEAYREGLDAIAITDHIEYQPHEKDVPTEYNRSYEIAAPYANGRNILLIHAAEITRDTPPGHFNALFLNDNTLLVKNDFLDAVKAAFDQDGFIFWNHPGWKGLELGNWREVHTKLYENHWLKGIEVCNGETYYPEAHAWALEKHLTFMGNSDVHDPMPEVHYPTSAHRTMTLVLAKERTVEAIHEALNAGRTVVYYKNQLIGNPEFLEAIFNAAVTVSPAYYHEKNYYLAELINHSDLEFVLGKPGMDPEFELVLPAQSTVQIRLNVKSNIDTLPWSIQVKNLIPAPSQVLSVTLTISLK